MPALRIVVDLDEEKIMNIDEDTLEQACYAMEKAYKTNNNRENAVAEVAYIYAGIETQVLRAMWSAIDAYVDMTE